MGSTSGSTPAIHTSSHSVSVACVKAVGTADETRIAEGFASCPVVIWWTSQFKRNTNTTMYVKKTNILWMSHGSLEECSAGTSLFVLTKDPIKYNSSPL